MRYIYDKHTKKREYQEFLASAFWQRLRHSRFEMDDYRCKHCGSSKFLQAHHTLYPKDWYQTTTDYLITLCRECHKKQHNIGSKQNKVKPKSKKQKRHKFAPDWDNMSNEERELRRRRAIREITRQQFKEEMLKLKTPPTTQG